MCLDPSHPFPQILFIMRSKHQLFLFLSIALITQLHVQLNTAPYLTNFRDEKIPNNTYQNPATLDPGWEWISADFHDNFNHSITEHNLPYEALGV